MPVAPVPATGEADGVEVDEVDEVVAVTPTAVRPASVPDPPAWPVVARTPPATADASVLAEEARVEPTATSRPSSPPAPRASEAGAPLRSPSRHSENGPRPASAPLWTASLTPVASDDHPVREMADDRDIAPGQPGPAASVDRVDDEDVSETPSDDPTGTSTDAAAVAAHERGEGDPSDAGGVAHDAARADEGSDVPAAAPPRLVHQTIDAPQDGDTAPVAALDARVRSTSTAAPAPERAEPTEPAERAEPGEAAERAEPGEAAEPAEPAEAVRPAPAPLVSPTPLVEPAPLVEPGSAFVPERCTQCGASIGEDDIFCGECGAVVQSVALSFTGPIAPLPPEWRPADAADHRRRPAPADDAGSDPASEPGTGSRSSTPAPDERPDDHEAADQRTSADPPTGDPAPGAPDGQGGSHHRPAARHAPEPIDHVPGFRAERPAVTPRPAVADLPPAPTSSSAPSWRPRRPPVDLPTDDDVDETRIVRRGTLGSEFVLQFSTGESITIGGTGLVGRAPAPQPGEQFDQLVRIVDPGKSVSKTHLEFGQEAGALWISDRWSGNGTVVRPRDLPPRRADPGVRVRVTRGTRVDIGEQFFVVV
jgi:hypothetical protein